MQSRAPCVGHARPLTHHKGTGTPWVSVGRNLALWLWVRPALLGVQPRLRESSCNPGLTGAVELSCNRGLGVHATTTSRGNNSIQTGVADFTVRGGRFNRTVTHCIVLVGCAYLKTLVPFGAVASVQRSPLLLLGCGSQGYGCRFEGACRAETPGTLYDMLCQFRPQGSPEGCAGHVFWILVTTVPCATCDATASLILHNYF